MRVNQEQASGSGAKEQRDEHTRKPSSLCNCGPPVDKVAYQEYDGRCRGSRKHTIDMKPSNCGTLDPHGEPPQTEEDVGNVNRRLALGREPHVQENSVCNQRYAERDRDPLGPHARTFRRLDDSRREVDSHREGSH